MRRFLLWGLLCVAFNAAAQYPTKPIRMVIHFPVGGSTDLVARVLAQAMGESLGQPVVVENKLGADGAIAAAQVMQAAPDGYTLFVATNTPMMQVPLLQKNPPYDPVTAFTPISLIGRYTFVLVSTPKLPANNMADFIAYARANPGKLNYGSGNSTAQLFGAQLVQLEKLNMVHVPYKGDGPLMVDLIGGRVHIAFATPGTAAPQVKDGKLRAFAAMFPNRSALLPEVPTAKEAGLGRMSLTPWGGVFGPKGMPRDVVDRIARELAVILKRPEVHEGFSKLAFEPKSSTPEELAAFLKQQMESWTRTAREAGIQPE